MTWVKVVSPLARGRLWKEAASPVPEEWGPRPAWFLWEVLGAHCCFLFVCFNLTGTVEAPSGVHFCVRHALLSTPLRGHRAVKRPLMAFETESSLFAARVPVSCHVVPGLVTAIRETEPGQAGVCPETGHQRPD